MSAATGRITTTRWMSRTCPGRPWILSNTLTPFVASFEVRGPAGDWFSCYHPLMAEMGPDVVEDQVRLGAGHVGIPTEVDDHELAEVVGAGGGDVDVEVVGPAEEEHVEHLGERGDLGHEVGDVPARVRLQPDGDHGLDRAADRGRVDVGVITADHAALP